MSRLKPLGAESENSLPRFPPRRALDLKSRGDLADVMRSNQTCKTIRQEGLNVGRQRSGNGLSNSTDVKAVRFDGNFR